MLALAALGAPAAHAQAACSLDVVGCSFGAYDIFSMAPLDSTGSITVSCVGMNEPLTVVLTLDAGRSGDALRRAMYNGPIVLEYNLYLDAARSQVWGNGLSGTSSSQVIVDGSPVTIPVFGRIPAAQKAATGAYADTLVVTVTY
ncbi:Csu type fimbrial protein [Myxococcus sp. Y35]|uniref:Csu type fimbrial protein n=1 Tax=Pseudomyxococcus flavus TaxID=3115648 RepID=UPI003CEF65C4